MRNIKAILSLRRRRLFGNIIKHLRIPKDSYTKPFERMYYLLTMLCTVKQYIYTVTCSVHHLYNFTRYKEAIHNATSESCIVIT